MNSLMKKFHLVKLLKVCLVVLVVSLTSANAVEPLYKAKGDDVVLDPHYQAPFITSIVWKHGSNIAAEWEGNNITCFRQFKGRCSLNLSTGALTIRGLNGSDDGYYSAEINEKQIDTKTQLTVISKVSKPSINKWCNTGTTYCILTCEENTEDARPISYKWFADDEEGPSKQEIEIEDTKEESFFCMLLNPVSSERSESISNPIIAFNERRRNIIIGISTAVVGSLFFGCAVLIWIRRRKAQRRQLIGKIVELNMIERSQLEADELDMIERLHRKAAKLNKFERLKLEAAQRRQLNMIERSQLVAAQRRQLNMIESLQLEAAELSRAERLLMEAALRMSLREAGEFRTPDQTEEVDQSEEVEAVV